MIETYSTCRMLFNGGLTINPDGSIVLCCVSSQNKLAHISEIDDLNQFYNSSLFNYIREKMKSGLLPTETCQACNFARKQGHIAAIDSWVPEKIKWTSDDIDYHTISFLEFAPSNICNQNCVMCGSFYSSKWVEWELDAIEDQLSFRYRDGPASEYMINFKNKVWSMSDEDLQKIYNVLPNVKRIVLKGGEPFADKRNYDLIRYCMKLEKPPIIDVTTNFSVVPNDVMDMISEYPNLFVSISIDGTNEIYEWVRGSSYKKTIENCQTYMKKTHDIEKISVAATPTLYTLYSLDDYILEIKNLGFTDMCFMRAGRPKYASIEAEENLDYYVQKYEKFLSTYDGMKVHFFENIYNRKYDINIDKSNVRDWIEFMNKKRGFDIRKYVPELNKF